MPAAPEGYSRRIVGKATNHVFWRVDAVDKRPKAEESPGQKKLQPENVEVEVREERELDWGVVGPVGITFGNCDAIIEV